MRFDFKFQSILGILAVIVGVFSVGASADPFPTNVDHHDSGFIQLSPFSDTSIDEEQMKSGIRTLLKSPTDDQIAATLGDAKSFRKTLQDAVSTRLARSDGGKIPYQDAWYEDGFLGLPQREYHEIRFQSLIQRSGNHPANEVVARYIVPARGSVPCDIKTVILIHGTTESSVDGTIDLADNMTSLNNIATLVVYLPQFGPRRILKNGHLDPEGSHTYYGPDELNPDYFILEDSDATKENILQSMLDLHVAIDWVHSIKRSKEFSSVAMMGLSLGSSFALIYEGLEPERLTGGDSLYAPGGNMIHAFTNVISSPMYQTDYEVQYAHSIHWKEDDFRTKWAGFDPMVWAGQIKNREFYFLSAEYDDTFVHPTNYDPIVALMTRPEAGNKIDLDEISTYHDPTVGTSSIYLAFNLFFPMMNYIRFHGHSAEINRCFPGSM